MSAGAEVLRDGPIGGKELLCLIGRLKPLHTPLALPGGLVRVLRPIVEIPVLAMFHPWRDLARGGSVALQLVGDNHARHVG